MPNSVDNASKLKKAVVRHGFEAFWAGRVRVKVVQLPFFLVRPKRKSQRPGWL
jgi:hypothetical protein